LDVGPLRTCITQAPLFCLDAIALGETKEDESQTRWIFEPIVSVAPHRISRIPSASSLAF
jgi:hypothetical protein